MSGRESFVPFGGGGGSQTLITATTLTSPGQFSATVPQNYNDLLAIFYVQSSSAGSTDTLDVTFNNDGGANYNVTHTITTNASSGPFTKINWDALIANPTIPCPALGVNFYSWSWIYIPAYTSSSFKVCKFLETQAFGVGNGQVNDGQGTGFWNSTAAITSIQAFAGVTPFTFQTPSQFRLYGIT